RRETSTSGISTHCGLRIADCGLPIVQITLRRPLGTDDVVRRRRRRARLEAIRTPGIERAAWRQRAEERNRSVDREKPPARPSALQRRHEPARAGVFRLTEDR